MIKLTLFEIHSRISKNSHPSAIFRPIFWHSTEYISWVWYHYCNMAIEVLNDCRYITLQSSFTLKVRSNFPDLFYKIFTTRDSNQNMNSISLLCHCFLYLNNKKACHLSQQALKNNAIKQTAFYSLNNVLHILLQQLSRLPS